VAGIASGYDQGDSIENTLVASKRCDLGHFTLSGFQNDFFKKPPSGGLKSFFPRDETILKR
jgi:hypothetical protein